MKGYKMYYTLIKGDKHISSECYVTYKKLIWELINHWNKQSIQHKQEFVYIITDMEKLENEKANYQNVRYLNGCYFSPYEFILNTVKEN